MTATEFQQISHKIPTDPGIYKYYDRHDELLYVGKAKSLRKRVSSYFTKTFVNYKTHELVQRISRVEFTIVNSEQDAFLLENSLIKQFQPRFNIDLKDDKSYPFMVFKNENFPRIFLTRRKIDDGSEYLGPFTSVHRVRELLNFIRATIQLRTCKLNLTPNNISKGKFKVCLEYHLGNCKGPCEGKQSEDEYREALGQVKNILKGNLTPVINHFKAEMKQYAGALDFERAELTRKKIEHLENYQARSVIVSRHVNNADVFSILRQGDIAYVNYLTVQNGTIVHTHTTQLQAHLDESDEEILAFAIAQLRGTFNSISSEIVLPFPIDYPEEHVVITVPKAGDKKKLLDLSEKNVNYFLDELKKKKILQLEGKDDMERKKVLYQLQEDLQLLATATTLEQQHEARDLIARKARDDMRPLSFPRFRGHDGFMLLQDKVGRVFAALPLADAPSYRASKTSEQRDLFDFRTGEQVKPVGKAVLYPVDCGQWQLSQLRAGTPKTAFPTPGRQ